MEFTHARDRASLLDEFQLYLRLYEELEPAEGFSQISRLLDIGREVQQGLRMWTKFDLELITRWKQLHPVMSRIEKNEHDIEERLRQAFSIREEDARIDFMCRTPGIGPVLTSLILTLTYPDKYAPLELHAWNALVQLGFDVTGKDNSGGEFHSGRTFTIP